MTLSVYGPGQQVGEPPPWPCLLDDPYGWSPMKTMKLERRLHWPLLVSALLLYIAVLAASAAYHYADTRNMLLDTIDEELLLGAHAVRWVLAEDFHDRALGPDAISADEDWRNIRNLSQLAQASGFAFVFTMVRDADALYLTSSNASEDELSAGEEVRYWHDYNEALPRAHAALDAGEPRYSTYTDRWGTFRAVLLPQQSPEGRDYVTGAELDIAAVNAQLRRQLAQSMGSALLLLLASVPAFLVLLLRERRHTEALHAANRELRETQQQLVQSERLSAIGALAAGVAHELNNPLMGLLNYIQHVAGRVDGDRPLKDVLDKAEHATRHCADIVRDLLLFSRGGDPARDEGREPIAAVLDRTLRLLDYRLSKEDVEVAQDLPAGLPPVPTRGTALQQVLMNLLVNALDAMEGRAERRIRIAVQLHVKPCGPGALRLRICDTGAGIERKDLMHIYDPFFTTKPTGRGTGLGLSVSLGLVQSAGGELHCYSTPGEGTCFTLCWPVVDAGDGGAAGP